MPAHTTRTEAGAYAVGHVLPWTGFTLGFWAAGLVVALGGIGYLVGPGLSARRPQLPAL